AGRGRAGHPLASARRRVRLPERLRTLLARPAGPPPQRVPARRRDERAARLQAPRAMAGALRVARASPDRAGVARLAARAARPPPAPLRGGQVTAPLTAFSAFGASGTSRWAEFPA